MSDYGNRLASLVRRYFEAKERFDRCRINTDVWGADEEAIAQELRNLRGHIEAMLQNEPDEE